MSTPSRPIAVVTGASTGIGLTPPPGYTTTAPAS
jgi:hypothetical protein